MPRIGLISDIHGNLEALEAVLADSSSCALDALVCLGDLVGYGPDPGPCLERAGSACDVVVIGNHDEAVLLPEIQARFNDRAQVSIRATQDLLKPRHLLMIGSLPETETIGNLTVTHATLGRRRYEYLYTAERAEPSLARLPTRYGAIGHTHRPAVFTRCPIGTIDESLLLMGVPLKLPSAGRVIVNPGSVGQPRDGIPEASWGVLDTSANTFEVRRIPYDIEAVAAKIAALGLPKFLGERLKVGS